MYTTVETVSDATHMLETLNPEQRKAVETTEGPVLVLAGAGTGKTKALTTRIAWLLANGFAEPYQILSVTFTNKAAAEMRERVEALVGSAVASGLWIGTFHSLSVRILRQHAKQLGFKDQFTIIDTDDQIRLIKSVMEYLGIDEKRYSAKIAAAIIDRAKDKALTPEQFSNEVAGDFAGGRMGEIYYAYQSRLLAQSAMDFGDLILHCITLFKKFPEVLQQFQHRFHYLLVDEYQDTNASQYQWMRLLAAGSNNLCCVGDDDQSIYGWRGAEVANILKFEHDFPNATLIRLERNYRSTKDILAAASALISNNKGRLGKTLWTEFPDSEKIKIMMLPDDKSEAKYIADEVEALQQLKALPLKEVAILVRAGFQTRSFEECLTMRAIPYRVVGGLRFYERMEIRDAISYLRVVYQEADDLALERIINTPKRGLGDASVLHIRDYALQAQVPMLTAIRTMLNEKAFKPKIEAALLQFVKVIDATRALPETVNLSAVAEHLLKESGYLDYWQKEQSLESEGRLENLKELFAAMQEYEDLSHFLEHVSLVSESDTIDQRNMLSIITMHSAKGLEFNTVFLAGWEEGIFPSERSLNEKGSEGLEEERRLAYVGITRAKRRAIVTCAGSRRMYQNYMYNPPSRFIGELPKEHVEFFKSSYNAYPAKMEQKQSTTIVTRPIVQKPKQEVVKKLSSNAWFGARVFHIKFGYGKVVGEQGEHLTIAFEKAGVKKILSDFIERA